MARPKGMVAVDPKYAKQHPEAVTKVGDYYYRPATSPAEMTEGERRGETSAQTYARIKQEREVTAAEPPPPTPDTTPLSETKTAKGERVTSISSRPGYVTTASGTTIYDPQAYARITQKTPGYYGLPGYGGEKGELPQIKDWGKKTPRQQFDTARKEGIIPKAAIFQAGTGKQWTYSTPESQQTSKTQVAEMNRVAKQVSEYQAAVITMAPYKYSDETYNVAAAVDAGVPKSQLKLLFTTETIDTASKAVQKEKDYQESVKVPAGFPSDAEYKKLSVKEKLSLNKKGDLRPKWGVTTWEAAVQREQDDLTGANLKKGAIFAAELFVPGVYQARHWDEMSVGEKAFMTAIDVLIVVPVIGAASRGARTVATAGKAARVSAAGMAALRESAAVVAAPVNMILHPVGTVKSTGKQLLNLAENIAHPSKLPEAIITTTRGTVRLKVSEATSAAEAKAIRDKLMDMALRGERPVVEIGGTKVELTRSPLMTELGGGLSHATPMGEAFEGGLKVAARPGVSAAEQGLFVSHEPLPKFAEASAFGKTGEKPVIIITSRETAELAIPTAKIYDSPVGKVAEMEKKFAAGTKIPEPKQKLFTRVGMDGQRVEIWLEKPLTARQIVKLKGQALVETITAPFKPAIKVKRGKIPGKPYTVGLAPEEAGELAKILKSSGHTDQARNLLRAERLARATRRVPTTLSRVFGRIGRTPTATRAARTPARPTRPRAAIARTSVARAARPTTEPPSTRIPGDRADREGVVPRGDRGDRPERADRPDRGERPGERARGDRPAREGDTPRGGRGGGRETPSQITDEGRRRDNSKLSDREKRRLINRSTGAIAFRMGQLGNKDVWHVVVDPYTQDDYVTVIGKRPGGASTIVRGPDSAYKTAQTIYGKTLDRKLSLDIGVTDAILEPVSGRKGIRISFKPDPKLSTRSDIDVSKRKGTFPLKG